MKKTAIIAALFLLLAACQQQGGRQAEQPHQEKPATEQAGNPTQPQGKASPDHSGGTSQPGDLAGQILQSTEANGKAAYKDEPVPAEAVKVSTLAELTAAIGKAEAGTMIVIADGTYNGASPIAISGKQGTEEKPITIRAEHHGQAIMTGKVSFNVNKSAYITIQGIRFNERGNVGAVKLTDSNHVRVTRNNFALTESVNTKWVELQGSNSNHNRIDHNEFGPRQELGQMIAFQGSGQISQYDVIENNYFHDIAPQKSNGGETIRLGLSGLSMSDGFITVQNNLFVNCDGDSEVVSDKTGHNTIRYNTFVNNKAQVTARHGHGSSFYGNFFIGDGKKQGVGGLRIYANDQKIYNNYFYRLTTDAINIDGGDFDGGPEGKNYTKDDLVMHWRVYRAQVVNNTIVDSTSGIIIGQSHEYPPVDVKVADNIVENSGGILYDEQMKTNAVFEGNIGFGAKLSSVNRTKSEIANVNPMLTESDGVMRLSEKSPAIDAAVGEYPFVQEDMDGQPRSHNDVGADEYATRDIVHKPLTPHDVGPDAQ